MASVAVCAAHPHSTDQHKSVHLYPGQLCTGVISIQRALYQLALSAANSHDIKLTTQAPKWEPLAETNLRPCVFLQRTLKGIHVLPLSTFQGNEPETWNLLLQEIVVPIGDKSTIRPIFHDRKAFQTEPAWTHREGHPTYIFPEIVILPLDAPLRRLPAAMSHSAALELKSHCQEVVKNLRKSPKVVVQSWIRSFEANPYGTKIWAARVPGPGDRNIVDNRDGEAKSSSNPPPTNFISRAVLDDVMSFPDLANSSNCGSTIAFSVTPPPSVRPLSIHQVLQDNTSLLSGQCDIVKSLQLRARREDDKENVGL